jgi:multiple antibiotic resistance protein
MEQESIIFSMFFLAIGPIKLIPIFGALTQQFELEYKRELAVKAAILATVIALILVLAGRDLLGSYRISQNAVQMAGGVILLLSALNVIFPPPKPVNSQTIKPTTTQLIINIAAPTHQDSVR